MKMDLYDYLQQNEYPGRGIVVGRSPRGNKAMIGYWIMGRSSNSRNRVFEPIDGGIRTVAADPAKLEDPHLIIYNPVRTVGRTSVVTNGDQTDTICDYMMAGAFPGYSFEAALSSRTFEDDRPNWTPRISAAVDNFTGGFKMSILKSNEGDERSVLRYTFDYAEPLSGEGRFISTYMGNGNPLPSFAGEPMRVEIDTADPKAFAKKLWASLNPDNRVSQFVRAIDLKSGNYKDVIINQYQAI